MSLQPQSSRSQKTPATALRGFSLIELLVVTAVLFIVLGGVVSYITTVTQRSRFEQTKVDLSQEGRQFVDEFERDIHQAGYPNCRMFNTGSNCPAQFPNPAMAVGLVSVSNTQIVFEGDVDGDGVVDSVRYRLVDSAGNYPPAGTCPCTMQRSQLPKIAGDPLAGQTAPIWSQELQEVVNSGVPGAALYGGGLPIAGNVLFGNGTITNTAYYAALTTVKDYPVFSAYDQNGISCGMAGALCGALPLDVSTVVGQQAISNIRSIRLTINLLGNGSSGYDAKTGVRPLVPMVGRGRINN